MKRGSDGPEYSPLEISTVLNLKQEHRSYYQKLIEIDDKERQEHTERKNLVDSLTKERLRYMDFEKCYFKEPKKC